MKESTIIEAMNLSRREFDSVHAQIKKQDRAIKLLFIANIFVCLYLVAIILAL